MILQSLALTGEQLTKKNRGNHLTRLLLEIFQAISKSLFQSEANCEAVKSWHCGIAYGKFDCILFYC